MNQITISENLTVAELMELRELIKQKVSNKHLRKASVKKYHKSEKGKEKLRQASKKYYHKKKKIKEEKELSNKISELEEQLKELKIKYSQI